jgi:hypothetical protein
VAKVILVGEDVALLEGLGQTLVGLGHDVTFATTVAEAEMANPEEAPALAVVSADALEDAGIAATLPLTPGGALIIYSTSRSPAISATQAAARHTRTAGSPARTAPPGGAGQIIR